MMRRTPLLEIISSNSAKHEHQAVFFTPDDSYSLSDMDSLAERLASYLSEIGVKNGDRVACLTKRAFECVILLLAASRIGAVCTPMNWRLSAVELGYVVKHSEARFLMVDSELSPLVDEFFHSNSLAIIRTEDIVSLSNERSANDAISDYNEIALQLYSSGTTGYPKGVELEHDGIIHQCKVIGREFAYQGEESVVFLNVLPVFHVSGLINILAVLYHGGTVVALPEFVPSAVIAAIEKYRVTESFMVPVMLNFLINAPEVISADLSSLRTIMYGGSPISPATLKKVREVLPCQFIQVYGMTEAAGMATCLGAADHDNPELLPSAGRAVSGVELRIVRIGTDTDCAEGEAGEIWSRAVSNMRGYFRDPKATSDVFPEGRDAKGGWYRTGDVGFLRNGYLFIRDRLKEMIISGGENIYPAEVENVIASHPAVAEVAVFGIPDARWGEVPRASIVTRAGVEVSEAEIIAYTRERLAHYKCPKSVEFRSDLPRNPSGKLLKRVLRDPHWQGHDRAIA